MRVFFVILVSFSFLFCFVPNSCITHKYVNAGESCTDPKVLCKDFHKCINGICTPSWIGSKCNSSEECTGDELVKCVNGKCVAMKYPDEDCEHDEECFSGKCNQQKKCEGKTIGEPCSQKRAECAKGLFCSITGNCIEQVGENENCGHIDFRDPTPGSNFHVVCKAGTMCMESYECEKVYYKKEGEECSNEFDCRFGLKCMNGTCKFPKHELPCSTGQCTAGQVCVCNDEKNGTCKTAAYAECGGYQASITNLHTQLYECWVRHNCPLSEFQYENLQHLLGANNCMGKNCGYIISQFFCCQMGNINQNYSYASLPSHINCPAPQVLPLWVVITIISVAAAVAIGVPIVAAGFWLALKKWKYEEYRVLTQSDYDSIVEIEEEEEGEEEEPL